MKKLMLLSMLFLAITTQVNAQALQSDDLIGNWKIVDVLVSMNDFPAEYKERMEAAIARFKNSKFEFREENRFSFDTAMPELKVSKGHWKYDEKTGSYVIQHWADRGTEEDILMWIYAKKEGDKTLFQLNETPLVFQVEKSE